MNLYLELYLLSCVPFLLIGIGLDWREFRREKRITDPAAAETQFIIAIIVGAMTWPVFLLGAIIWKWWKWLN